MIDIDYAYLAYTARTAQADWSRSAMLLTGLVSAFWVLRDPTRAACANMTLVASRQVLREGFERDQLHCIGAWAAQSNIRSQRLLARLGFRLIGLQRDCHVVDGQRMGRLFDLLPHDLSFPTPI